MSDIFLQWDVSTGFGDFQFANGDILTGAGIEDLATAILISLFTDLDWWANTYEPVPLGSQLSKLYRAKKNGETGLLLQARDYCKQALQWLIDDGVADSINVSTSWLTANQMGIAIQVFEPSQKTPRTFNFSWAWATPVPPDFISPDLLDQNWTLDRSSFV